MSKLTRSTNDKILAGVCGGLAERFGLDATLVRILYVIISLASVAFPGTIVYFILWFIMPKDNEIAIEAGKSSE